MVHHVCYSNTRKKSNKDYVVLKDSEFCTTGRQKDYVKESRTYNHTQANGGPGGKDDPRSSEFYLIEYLNTDETLQTGIIQQAG
jgi:hypothetical protein